MIDVVVSFFLCLLYLNRFTDNPISKAVPAIILIIIFIKYNALNKSKGNNFLYKKNKLLLALFIIMSIGLLRTNNPDTSFLSVSNSLVLFVAFVLTCNEVLFYVKNKYNNSLPHLHRVVVIPFFLYVLTNLMFWLLGYESANIEKESIGHSLMLSSIGIDIHRVNFPFTNGINSYATLLGMVLTVQLLYTFLYRKNILLSITIVTSIIVSLLLTDSRSALIYSIVIPAGIYLIRNKTYIKYLKYVPLFTIFGPFLMLIIIPSLSTISFFSFLSRSDADFYTGNSRFLIWSMSISKLLVFEPIHLIGYGIFGHFKSGASLMWAPFFGYMKESDLVHPHNSILSILFDYGYLGLIIFITFLHTQVATVLKNFHQNKTISIMYLGFLVFFVMMCMTESLFGFYYLDNIYIIFIWFLIPPNLIFIKSKVRKFQTYKPIKKIIYDEN